MYIHANKIVHKDLKLDNIMLTWEDDQVKLIDFGVAIKLMVKEQRIRTSEAECGTKRFRPPESFQKLTCSFKTDVWAFGCVILYLATGRKPYPTKAEGQLDLFLGAADCPTPLEFLLEGDAELLSNNLAIQNPDLRAVIEKCFLPVEERGAASEVLEMDFFKKRYSGENIYDQIFSKSLSRSKEKKEQERLAEESKAALTQQIQADLYSRGSFFAFIRHGELASCSDTDTLLRLPSFPWHDPPLTEHGAAQS